MGRLSLAVLEERLLTMQAQIDGLLVDVATELEEMARRVERADLTCTDLRNRMVALESRRKPRRRGK